MACTGIFQVFLMTHLQCAPQHKEEPPGLAEVTARGQLPSHPGYHPITMQHRAEASTASGNGLRSVQPCNLV